MVFSMIFITTLYMFSALFVWFSPGFPCFSFFYYKSFCSVFSIFESMHHLSYKQSFIFLFILPYIEYNHES